jgi:hypothetical protein
MSHSSFLYKEQMMEESLQAAHAAIKELSKRVAEKPSIRDQFAMAVLTGLVASNCGKKNVDKRDVASWAYGIADAMMEARK